MGRCRILLLGLRLQHLHFIVNLTSLQTRDLEKNTFPGNDPHAIDFCFLWCHFLPMPSSFSQTLTTRLLGIIELYWFVSSVYQLLSADLFICLLSFNSVCALLIISVL